MGNCFKKEASTERLTAGDATASEDFSAGVDSLFADLGAETVQTIKSGPLEKLGGRDKSKWERKHFDLTNTGLSWDGGKKSISGNQIVSVRPKLDTIGDFSVATEAKDGKTYVFRADAAGVRDEWVAAFKSLINQAAIKLEAIGDDGAGEAPTGAPAQSAEELEAAEREKQHKRAERKAKMAAMKAKAKSQAAAGVTAAALADVDGL